MAATTGTNTTVNTTNSIALREQFEDAAGVDGILSAEEAKAYVEANPDSLLSVSLQDLSGNFNTAGFNDLANGDGEVTQNDLNTRYETLMEDTAEWILNTASSLSGDDLVDFLAKTNDWYDSVTLS